MSKLGIIMIGWQTEGVLWAINNKPTAVEFMMTRPLSDQPMEEISLGVKVSQVELVKMLAQASPKTLLVIRAYPDDYDHSDFQDRMLKWSEPFREVSDRVVAHSVNEPVIFNPDMAKRLNEYEVDFIERMAENGLIPMCFCLSESHLTGPTLNDNGTIKDWGNLPLWWYMKDGMRLLAEKDGFWGPNEYDWKSWCASRHRGWKWRLGHWEVSLDVLKRHLQDSQMPMIGIGEGVLDGKIWTSQLPQDDPRYNKPWGWQYIKSSPDHLKDIKGIEIDSYCKPGVAFYLLFAWAPQHHDWRTYDISRMKDLLSQYLVESPPRYWESNGENAMEQPIRVLMPDDTVQVMELEEYLRGVVGLEIGYSAPPEAIKAQAVAARCYALNAIKNPRHAPKADICTTTHCQVWGETHWAQVDNAIEATKGVTATWNGEVINAFYFGHCDGRTRNSEDVWVQRLPYCRSVPCGCGYNEMYGHGVGMCQRGAIAMAESGASYQEILAHYYTGIKVNGYTAPPKKDYKQNIVNKLEAIQQLAESGLKDAENL